MSLESGDGLLDFTEKLPGKSTVGDEERNNRIVNSSVACLAAFSIVYISVQMVTALVGKYYLIFYKLFFFKVEFTTNDELYTLEAVRMTHSAGPFLCVAGGIVCLFIHKQNRKRPGILKIFWLWLGVHYLNFFCMEMVLIPIKENQGIYVTGASNLGKVADYFYLEDFVKIIFAIVASVLMILVGFIVSKGFIQLTNSTTHVYKAENRIIYLFQTVFLPYVITSGIALIYFGDGSFIVNLTLVITLFIIILSLFINGLKNKMIMIYRMPETGTINNRFLIAVVSGLIFIKLFLNNGIQF